MINAVRRSEYIENKAAVEKTLWQAAYEIAATKRGIAIDREKFELLYARNVKQKGYYKPKSKTTGA